ncbi:NADP-dependent malic enzyme [Candidatus Micrarchaeota archaeon]|nr:NADP-dependent malic enzyme [Candidatus Micrarchaeota archaeon]
MDIYEQSARMHLEKKGKLEVRPKVPLATRQDLSLAYTPGVAEPSRRIAEDKPLVFDYTIKGNCVAVVSDGSAVLGLGNIGADAAIPVMEGKAALFKEFAGIDAFPICIRSQDAEEIISVVKNIEPVFGGINLEDIAAPRCFEVEAALQDIGIPVMHDDQHGTAIVVLAAVMNAAKVVGKRMDKLSVVISGSGAAGTAVSKMLLCNGMRPNVCTPVRDVRVADTGGILHSGREGLNPAKEALAKITNRHGKEGTLADAMRGADVFIGLSAANIVSKEMVASMAPGAMVFAMANPTPEISYEDAKAAGAAVVGTGRSDFPNQINNVLAFPGVFRGALDAKATRITDGMKLAAAYALAGCVTPTAEAVLPSPLDRSVVPKVADAVRLKAIGEGVVRKQ